MGIAELCFVLLGCDSVGIFPEFENEDSKDIAMCFLKSLFENCSSRSSSSKQSISMSSHSRRPPRYFTNPYFENASRGAAQSAYVHTYIVCNVMACTYMHMNV
uniref:Uncharacterized protein n=1 Tax=Parascaris equorum TaxID=6256 RepID=A0A914RPF4_PAREQ